MFTPPLHRFQEFGSLTASEHEAIIGMADIPYRVRKGRVIQDEGVDVTGFFILLEGWVAAASMLQDGGRQIQKIHLPGDALGTPSMAMRQTTEKLIALTEVKVVHVSLKKFGELFDKHPRVAARFMLSIQLERIALMDRLVSVGKTSSKARVAAFLLDLMDRLAPLGLVKGCSFDLFVTQEQIGDVLGLTAVHVSRMIAGLNRAGLIERAGRRVKLVQVDALETLADRPHRSPFADQHWLPAAR